MGIARLNRAGHRAGWAIREALVVFVVAFLVTASVYAIGLRGHGADLSQRLIVAASQSPLRFVPPRQDVAVAPRSWVLIDVVLDPCTRAGPRCDPAASLKGDRLAHLLRRVREAGPRLVIVDVLLASAGGPGLSDALKREFNAPGPPILVAWDARKSMHERGLPLVFADRADEEIVDPQAFRYARFLPAFVSGRPQARNLLPFVCVQGSTGRARAVPTLPYGGALIASGRTKDVATLDRTDLLGSLEATAGAPQCEALPAKSFATTKRIFSAGSLRAAGDESASNYWLSAGKWLHFRPRADGDAALPLRVINNGVVVIGSASLDAADTHWTALGDMTGAEIVLNDVRQYALTEPRPDPGYLPTLLGKWPLLLAGLVAAFIISVVWPLREAEASSETSLRPFSDRLRAAVASAAKLILTLLLTAAFFVLILWQMPYHLGAPPDFVTPFFALGIEGLFEFAFRFILAIRLLLRLEVHGNSP